MAKKRGKQPSVRSSHGKIDAADHHRRYYRLPTTLHGITVINAAAPPRIPGGPRSRAAFRPHRRTHRKPGCIVCSPMLNTKGKTRLQRCLWIWLGPKALNPSGGGDVRVARDQRKIQCDSGRRDQAVTALRNCEEPLCDVHDLGCELRFVILAAR